MFHPGFEVWSNIFKKLEEVLTIFLLWTFYRYPGSQRTKSANIIDSTRDSNFLFGTNRPDVVHQGLGIKF